MRKSTCSVGMFAWLFNLVSQIRCKTEHSELNLWCTCVSYLHSVQALQRRCAEDISCDAFVQLAMVIDQSRRALSVSHMGDARCMRAAQACHSPGHSIKR